MTIEIAVSDALHPFEERVRKSSGSSSAATGIA